MSDVWSISGFLPGHKDGVVVSGLNTISTVEHFSSTGHSTPRPEFVLSASLCETHTHGALGFAVSSDEAGLTQLLSALRNRGVGAVQLSTVTLGQDDLHTTVSAARQVRDRDGLLVGIHLEGPFLSPDKRGAHTESLLRIGTIDTVQALVAPHTDIVTAITVDPVQTSPEAIDWLLEAGITVAVGHTMATYEQTLAAFAQGASVLTHAFNAMGPISARDPGPVMAAIDSGAWIEVIADGHHVHPSLIRWLFREASSRVILVSDSMPAAGLADGAYHLGDLEVTVIDAVARTTGGSLAGSTLSLHQAVSAVVGWGVPLVDALQAATDNPRTAYGLPLAKIATGEPADVVLWSTEGDMQGVLTKGMFTPAPSDKISRDNNGTR